MDPQGRLLPIHYSETAEYLASELILGHLDAGAAIDWLAFAIEHNQFDKWLNLP